MEPAVDGHAHAGLKEAAHATDYVRGLADLSESGRPPLYAHLTLARAALEASAVSAWLSEPQISTLDRMKRGLCEFLYSAREVTELELSQDAATKVAWGNDVARSFGWEVDGSRGRPKIGSVKRPRIGSEVSRLSGGTGDGQVGNLLYSRPSAVDHVTWFGLISAFDIDAAKCDERTGTATVPIGVDGERFASYVYYVVAVGAVSAAEMPFANVWLVEFTLESAAVEAEELEQALLRAALNSAPSPR